MGRGGPNAVASPWQAWLAPDLSIFLAILTLFYCLLLYDGGQKLFRDSDTGWHIRTGEAMLEERRLPSRDPYSFTKAGEAWFAWEWGADLAMGAAHRWDGLRGVAFLYAVAIALCTWLWCRMHWAAGGDFFLVALFAVPMLSTVNLHWLARPHVFSWLLLLGGMLFAERSGRQWAPVSILGVFAGAACWANVHGSFFLAFSLPMVAAAGYGLREMVWAIPSRRDAIWFVQLAGIAFAASFVNPFGWQLHRHVFEYLRNDELLSRIGEFQSFNFHVEGAVQIAVTVLVSIIGGILCWQQRRPDRALIVLLFAGIALRSARGLPLLALVALPYAGGAIRRALGESRELRVGVRRGLDGVLGYTGRLRILDRACGGYALVPVVLLMAFGLMHLPAYSARIGFPPEEFPVAAAAAVDRLPEAARILAPDKFGGYLIYRFEGRRKVFFDGRSDFYGTPFMKDYIALVEVRPGWREHLAKHDFSHALLPVNYSLIPALAALGWTEVSRDGTAVLLAQPAKP